MAVQYRTAHRLSCEALKFFCTTSKIHVRLAKFLMDGRGSGLLQRLILFNFRPWERRPAFRACLIPAAAVTSLQREERDP